MVVAYSIFFFMVEFDNYTKLLSSLTKIFVLSFFSHESVSFLVS